MALFLCGLNTLFFVSAHFRPASRDSTDSLVGVSVAAAGQITFGNSQLSTATASGSTQASGMHDDHVRELKCTRADEKVGLRESTAVEAAEKRSARVLKYIQKEGLTFLTSPQLLLHRQLLAEVEARGVPGSIVETGVAKGGSALLLAAGKRQDRCMHLYDTFEGIPPPGQKDGSESHRRYDNIHNGSTSKDSSYYGNMKNLLGYVQARFVDSGIDVERENVFFHKGLFEQTFFPDFPIAYIHLDGDWYNSTYHVLKHAVPHLQINGTMVIDDIDAWSGCKRAFDAFFGVNLTTDMKAQQVLHIAQNGKQFECKRSARFYCLRIT